MSMRSSRCTRRVSSPSPSRFSWPQHPYLEAERAGLRPVSRSGALSALSAAILAGSVLMPCVTPVRADVSNGADGSLRAAPENSGPSVQIVQPGYADQIKGVQQILVAIGTRRFAPQAIELFVDGKSATPTGPIPFGASPLPTLPSALFNWPTAQYADGPHKLTVRVTDIQGFIGQAEVQVYVNNSKVRDLTPPSLTWLNPPSSALKGVVKLQLRAQDKFGVKFVVVSLNPAANPDVKPPLRSWFANVPPYAVALDTRALADGLYVLKAIGTDAMGNEGEAQTLQVGVNNSGSGLDPFVLPRNGGTTMLPKVAPFPAKPAPFKAAPLKAAPAPAAPVKTVTKPAVVQPPARVVAVPDAAQNTDAPPQLSLTTGERNGAIGSVLSQPLAGRETPDSRSLVMPRTSSPRLASRLAPETDAAPVASEAALSEAAMTAVRPAPSAPRQVNPSASVAAKPATPNRFTSRPAMPHLTPRAVEASQVAPQAAPPVVGMAQANGSASQPRAAMPLRPRAATINPPFRVAAVPQQPRPEAVPAAVAPAQLTPLQTPTRSREGSRIVMPTRPAVSQPAPRSGVPQAVAPQAARPATNLAMLPPSAVPAPRSSAMITVAPFVNDAHPLSHIAREGETMAQIAARYNLPAHVLATVNHRGMTARFKQGEVVKLAQPLAVSYGGQAVQSDVDSLMIGSTGVTPFRFLFQQQGGKLEWDSKRQRVVAHDGRHEITLTIGSDVAIVNKQEVAMDLAAFLLSGRTMVPLRFFEKALHAQVEWNPSTGGLYVAMAN